MSTLCTSKIKTALVFIVFFGSQVGLAQWNEITGEIGSAWSYAQKPSALKDQSAYRVPLGILGGKFDFEDDVGAVVEASYGRTRETATGRAQFQIEKVYLQVDEISETVSMRFGQIPNSWVEVQEQESPFAYYLGSTYQPISVRLNEVNRADSGISVLQTWSTSSLEISLTNGEGAGQDEKGARKELQVFYQLNSVQEAELDGRWLLALGLVEGGYDNIDASISQKERLLFFLKYEKPQQAWASLELMGSKDPVDGINQKVGDQVDLTDLGGLVARGSGGGLEIGSWLGEKTAAQVKYEYWNPAQGVDARGLTSRMLGFHFFPRQHLQFSLAWIQVQYEKNHSVLIRDSEEVAFGARLRWP